MPAHATALGKALLAARPRVTGELAGRSLLYGYTPATVIDARRLRQELELSGRRGWATEVGELYTGRASIAAPIEDRRRATVGAIGITGAADRLCEHGHPRRELIEQVTGTARAVSRELGAWP